MYPQSPWIPEEARKELYSRVRQGVLQNMRDGAERAISYIIVSLEYWKCKEDMQEVASDLKTH